VRSSLLRARRTIARSYRRSDDRPRERRNRQPIQPAQPDRTRDYAGAGLGAGGRPLLRGLRGHVRTRRMKAVSVRPPRPVPWVVNGRRESKQERDLLRAQLRVDLEDERGAAADVPACPPARRRER
jgi:hypothetical protein